MKQTEYTMEPSSAPAHRGHVLWQRVLLAVSLLTFWNLPTTTQLTIESVPVNAAEGTDVLLLVYNVTENILGYGWFRGEKVENSQQIASYLVSSQLNVPGPAYSGRETIYANGSLLFQNVFQNDTGYYTLLVTTDNLSSEAAPGQLQVFPKLPTPIITSNNSNPLEHQDTVVLTCEPETQNTTYMWWINNQSLPDSARLELSKDNRTLTLLHVTRNDTGPYVCETQNPVSAGRSDPFTLNVLYDPTQGSSSGLSDGAIAGIVIGAVAGVALIAALVYFLYVRKTGRYDAFPLVPLSPRLTATLGRGKETSSLCLAWICSSFFLKLCFPPLIPAGLFFPGLHASPSPLSLGHGYSHPHLV
ncbi:cell adhesion molecule CEACAM7 isoform X5 [Vicugna pacos]|uniref:Cell adhesion molecule CEACAM7 isoform X5 n=1 Tax=Vicugna pacos TaxID=30538 RepID=A0ABM5DQG3_VICPA